MLHAKSNKSDNGVMKKSISGKVFLWIMFAVMMVFAASFIFCFVWLVLNSFRAIPSFNSRPSSFFDFSGVSKGTFWDNYREVFDYSVTYTMNRKHVSINFGQMFVNSLIYIAITVSGGIVFPPLVGYVMAKYDFKIKSIITAAVIFTMCVPGIGTTTAQLVFFDKTGISNTWFSIFLMTWGGFGFGVLLYTGTFKSVPWEYAESAKIDGAGNLRIYLSIMLPQAVPMIIAQSILTFIGCWNDYETPLLFLRHSPTVALGVNNIAAKFTNAYPIVFAALAMTSTFTLILYAFFSKKIMSSMVAGGLKG